MSTAGMRRPPPGGRSTIVFGSEANAEEKINERYQAEIKERAKDPKIPPEQLESIKGMMGSCADVSELVKKLQTDILGVHSEMPMQKEEDDTSGFSPPSEKVVAAMEALHAALSKRGTDTLVRLGKSFRIMDDDNSNGLSYEEFKKGMREVGVELAESHCQALFRFFDADCSGYLSFAEFMKGVRPTMNARRAALVQEVFTQMDINDDGALTVQDVSGKYDCTLHPDVIAGSRTEVEVLQSFLAGFDGSLGQKTGIVTLEKFVAYYSSVSASVDDDDYFDLILRNTWHLPGAEDTTCRRLLVTKEDGTQSIEEIEDDIDISKEDLQAIKSRLRESGVPVVKVALYGYVEQGVSNIMSSSMSPKKTAKSTTNGSRPATAEANPDDAVAAYKARMSTSNVSFA